MSTAVLLPNFAILGREAVKHEKFTQSSYCFLFAPEFDGGAYSPYPSFVFVEVPRWCPELVDGAIIVDQ